MLGCRDIQLLKLKCRTNGPEQACPNLITKISQLRNIIPLTSRSTEQIMPPLKVKFAQQQENLITGIYPLAVEMVIIVRSHPHQRSAVHQQCLLLLHLFASQSIAWDKVLKSQHHESFQQSLHDG